MSPPLAFNGDWLDCGDPEKPWTHLALGDGQGNCCVFRGAPDLVPITCVPHFDARSTGSIAVGWTVISRVPRLCGAAEQVPWV